MSNVLDPIHLFTYSLFLPTPPRPAPHSPTAPPFGPSFFCNNPLNPVCAVLVVLRAGQHWSRVDLLRATLLKNTNSAYPINWQQLHS